MPAVDLVEMPVAEKLQLMEALWDSLCSQASGAMTSPAWHAGVLEERLRRLASGEETTAPWREAKERIRARTKAS